MPSPGEYVGKDKPVRQNGELAQKILNDLKIGDYGGVESEPHESQSNGYHRDHDLYRRASDGRLYKIGHFPDPFDRPDPLARPNPLAPRNPFG